MREKKRYVKNFWAKWYFYFWVGFFNIGDFRFSFQNDLSFSLSIIISWNLQFLYSIFLVFDLQQHIHRALVVNKISHQLIAEINLDFRKCLGFVFWGENEIIFYLKLEGMSNSCFHDYWVKTNRYLMLLFIKKI